MKTIVEAYLTSYRHDYYPTLHLRIRGSTGDMVSHYVTNALMVASILSFWGKFECFEIVRGKDHLLRRCREIECPYCWESVPGHMRHTWV